MTSRTLHLLLCCLLQGTAQLEFTSPMCGTQDSWDTIEEAQDITDSVVKVSPVVYIGKLTIAQNFYTSRCTDTSGQCRDLRGDQNTGYKCETTYGYTYAYLQRDAVTWGMIKIPVGCRCVYCNLQEEHKQREEIWKISW